MKYPTYIALSCLCTHFLNIHDIILVDDKKIILLSYYIK